MGTRRRTVVAAAAAAILALTGCAGRGSSSDDDKGTAGGKVTLKFWNGFTGPDRPAVEELVKRYNGAQDKVTVQMEIMPWDVFYQKLLPSLSSADGPDMVAMDTAQMAQYADRGVLAPLDSYYDDADAKNLVTPAVDATAYKGVKYGVPMNFTTVLLYWNKEMFKAAGLDPEKPPATWEEFADAARKTTKDTNGDGKPEQYGLAIADHETVPMWPILLWQNGGGVVSPDGTKAMLDDPATVEAMEFWRGLVVTDKVAPIGLGGADADKLFQSKKAAMEIVGPWMTTGFKEAGIDFGLAMPPAGKEKVTLGTSVAFNVNKRAGEAKTNAAKEFMKFWNSKDSQVYWSVNSGFPPSRTDIPADALAANPYVAEFAKYAQDSRFFLANVRDFQKVNEDIFEPALQQVLNGKGSTQDLFGKASTEIQTVLDGAK
jgi:multiple sugar transport system substrate-binding protein